MTQFFRPDLSAFAKAAIGILAFPAMHAQTAVGQLDEIPALNGLAGH
jgi:hypothetical protein